MKKRTMKRILVATLATTLVLGSSITALADSADGTGSYEGGEMKYPTLSVTLPTIPEGTYNYIADPNGLIEATAAAKYEGATFTGDGIFFLSDEDTYTATSAALAVTNENAQDIDVTVKLEQKTAGDEGIAYADAATFEETDKAQKLYLAVVDNAETPNKAALAADKAATLTTTLEGVPANYEPSWTEANGYGYTLKDEADLTDWNECEFALTGALNTNATWGDEVTFPEITVTWSYAEHSDGLSITGATKVDGQNYGYTATFTKGTPLALSATGLTAATWSASVDGTYNSSANITVANGTMTIAGNMWGSVASGDKRYVKLTVGEETYIVQITVSAE